MDFYLWNRAAVAELIIQEYGFKLHVRSVGKYLKHWGFTAQQPIKLACIIGGARQKLSTTATLTNQRRARWMIIDDAFDADKPIEFLAALIKDAGKSALPPDSTFCTSPRHG